MNKQRVFVLVLIIFLLPGLAKAVDKNRFMVELFYGFSTMNPADLNLRPETDLGYRQFSFEQSYMWLRQHGLIRTYRITNSGEFPDIHNAALSGFRLRCRLSRKLDVSLGYKKVMRTETTTPTSTCIVADLNLVVTKETDTYHYYSLTAGGHCPVLGIHWRPEPGNIHGEVFLTAGPIFGQCSYSFHNVYTKRSAAGDILDSRNWQVEEKGHGIGVALEAGGRLGFKLIANTEFFCEAGYNYQGLINPSGKGSEELNGESKSWQGKWAIKEHFVYGYTGNYTSEFPSNLWEGQEHLRVRDFILNLSGVFVRAGISYRF